MKCHLCGKSATHFVPWWQEPGVIPTRGVCPKHARAVDRFRGTQQFVGSKFIIDRTTDPKCTRLPRP